MRYTGNKKFLDMSVVQDSPSSSPSSHNNKLCTINDNWESEVSPRPSPERVRKSNSRDNSESEGASDSDESYSEESAVDSIGGGDSHADSDNENSNDSHSQNNKNKFESSSLSSKPIDVLNDNVSKSIFSLPILPTKPPVAITKDTIFSPADVIYSSSKLILSAQEPLQSQVRPLIGKSPFFVIKPGNENRLMLAGNSCESLVSTNGHSLPLVHHSLPLYAGTVSNQFNAAKTNTCNVFTVVSSMGAVLPVPIGPIQVSNNLLCAPVIPSLNTNKGFLPLNSFPISSLKAPQNLSQIFSVGLENCQINCLPPNLVVTSAQLVKNVSLANHSMSNGFTNAKLSINDKLIDVLDRTNSISDIYLTKHAKPVCTTLNNSILPSTSMKYPSNLIPPQLNDSKRSSCTSTTSATETTMSTILGPEINVKNVHSVARVHTLSPTKGADYSSTASQSKASSIRKSQESDQKQNYSKVGDVKLTKSIASTTESNGMVKIPCSAVKWRKYDLDTAVTYDKDREQNSLHQKEAKSVENSISNNLPKYDDNNLAKDQIKPRNSIKVISPSSKSSSSISNNAIYKENSAQSLVPENLCDRKNRTESSEGRDSKSASCSRCSSPERDNSDSEVCILMF